MSDKLPVFGFLGRNPCTPEAIAGNLSDTLPETVIFIVPEDISRGKTEHMGLRTVAKWILAEYDEDDLIYSSNVMIALDEYAEGGHEVELILLYNPESSEDMDIRRQAAILGITVIDLAQNMYVLPPPPVDSMTPGEIDSNPEIPSEPRTRGVPRDIPAPQQAALPAPVQDQEKAAESDEDTIPRLVSFMDIQRALADYVRVIVRQEVQALGLVPGVNKPPVVERTLVETEDPPPWEDEAPTPPMPAEAVEEKRFKYTRDDEGMHRPRRPGRLRAGLAQVMLTQAEITELKERGKLVSE